LGDTVPETLQSTFFDQIDDEPAEAKRVLIVAETWSQEPAEVDVSNAGAVAVAMLQAKVCHPSDDEAPEILVGEMSRLLDCRENVESSPADRVSHKRQVDECLNRPDPELPQIRSYPCRTSSSGATTTCRRYSRPASTARSLRFKVV